MNLTSINEFLWKRLTGIRKHIKVALLIQWTILFVVITSCKSDPYGTQWTDGDNLTIYQYLEENREEYSEFYSLLEKGKLLGTLGAYNPFGDDYTLFLPTNEAIDYFIRQNEKFKNFEELLQDTAFVYDFTRYHTIKRKVRTDQFPDGALPDSTLTGERLVSGIYTANDNPVIKINNKSQVIKPNLEMTNGCIHVISAVLQPPGISGYDWLQQQDDYSILAAAMEFCRIRNRLWFNKYTILAEHDSVYNRNGIYTFEDLSKRLSLPGNADNFYQFTAYHIISGEYYLNDFSWGDRGYRTLSNNPVTVYAGLDIQINPGVDTYGILISESGDTTIIDYIRPVWEDCNILTQTGPVHSISDLLFYKTFPE